MSSERDIAIVLGTRPEIIKLATVIRLLDGNAEVIYTGQHSDDDLSSSFFTSFRIPRPRLQLKGISGEHRGAQIARAIDQLHEHFRRTQPKLVVVQGDTNATSAGAQAANYCDIPVLHIEAGLRSYDASMPEEINRRVVSVLSTMHCAPTAGNAENLVREGISPHLIRVTGNTIVEAMQQSLPREDDSLKLIHEYGLEPDQYVLVTIHRPENTDSRESLTAILEELSRIPLPVVFPMHPRTLIRAHSFGLGTLLNKLRCLSPLGHSPFLAMARHARLLISDSGGLQEECTVIKKPLIVVRNNTERPESFEAGFSIRVDVGPDIHTEAARFIGDPELSRALESSPCPFGDGKASERIVDIAQAMVSGDIPPHYGIDLASPAVYQTSAYVAH